MYMEYRTHQMKKRIKCVNIHKMFRIVHGTTQLLAVMLLLLNYILIPLPFTVDSKEYPLSSKKYKLEIIASEYLFLPPRWGISLVKEMAQPAG